MAIIPLLRDKLAVPAQDRIKCNNGTNFSEYLPAESFAFDSQTSPLVIGERDALLAVRFLRNLILGAQVLDDPWLGPSIKAADIRL